MRATRLLTIGLLAALVGLPAGADELPADWQATSLETFDGESFSVAIPPPAILQRDFSRFSLTRFRDARVAGSSARWQLRAREGVTEASLLLPAKTLDGVAVWIKNPLEHGLELSVRLTDAQGKLWRTDARPLLEHKGWFRYFFDPTNLSEEGQPPALPYATVELLLSGLQAGQEYTLYLDELTALQAPPPQVRVLEFTAPTNVSAGRAMPVQLRLQSQEGAQRPFELSVWLMRGSVPASVKTVTVDPGQPRTELAVIVPRHLAGGSYQLKLTARAADLSGALTRDLMLEATPPAQKIGVRPAAEGGCFTVDEVGLPIIGSWWRGRAVPQQAAWLMLPLTSDFDFMGQCAPVWTAPDKYDYTVADALLAAALGANPSAYVLPIVAISSPPWWDKEHPKELMVFGDGGSQLPAAAGFPKRTCASWASPVWRKDAAAALARLIQHLEAGPWGPAIIGYQLASGEDGRWVYPGATTNVFADYSHPQQEAFRAWLKEKYQDLGTLRMAWGQPRDPVKNEEALREIHPIISWGEARVPAQARRTRAPSGVLHEPTAAQEVVDYQIFCSDLVVETIRHLARAAKEATGAHKLVGAAYGHVFDLAGTRYGLQNGGHLALAPIYQAPELDFIVSSGTSGESGAPPLITTATASAARHGKLWLAQGEARQAAATVAHAVAAGGVAAVEPGPGGLPDATLTRLQALPPRMPRRSVSEIAVIVDDISAAYTACGSDLVRPLLSEQRLGLSVMGAPCDVWTLDDMLAGEVGGYDLYIFLDAFYLDAGARRQLVRVLSERKCTALWIYAPGAIDANINTRLMKELTGLTFVRPLRRLSAGPGGPGEEEGDGAVKLTDKGPLQVKIAGPGGYTYGAELPITPRFACADDRADIRGSLLGSAYGGFAVLDLPGFKSVWSAAPHLPASLLRSIALDADTHLYADSGTGVYANENLLVVRAGRDGEQRVRLPRLAEVVDLETGQPVGQRATEFVAHLKAGEIKLYYWGTAPLVDK
jgi:hypothetical protein